MKYKIDPLRMFFIFILKSIANIDDYLKFQNDEIDKENYYSRLLYPQTWALSYRVPKIIRKLFVRGCGNTTGHEISNTERGYDGGKFYEYHCRWCDKLIKIPCSEMPKDNWLKDLFDKDKNENTI